jgi:hypothetical protein
MVFLAASANLQVHSHKVPHVLVFLCPFFCVENEASFLSYVSKDLNGVTGSKREKTDATVVNRNFFFRRGKSYVGTAW